MVVWKSVRGNEGLEQGGRIEWKREKEPNSRDVAMRRREHHECPGAGNWYGEYGEGSESGW